MKMTRQGFSARYTTALRAHFSPESKSGDASAAQLGRHAVQLGLDAVDLARIHQDALRAFGPELPVAPGRRLVSRAHAFFAQVMAPAHRAQRRARQPNPELAKRVALLEQHAARIARGQRHLQREVVRRKAGEVKIVRARERYRTLLLESQVMQGKLRQLTRQIISAQEDERKKISRELHDQVVQTLVGVNVALTALSRSATIAGVDLSQKIARTCRLVEKSVGAVHRFARELRPAVLDDIGLIPALHAFSQNLAAKHKLRIQMTAFRGVEAVSVAKRTVLYRVAQEALTNVVRHANATLVHFSITDQGGAVRLEIVDNGKSFPVLETLRTKNHRLGLVGMRERVEMVGGRFTLQSTPGTGTMVRADIPFGAIAATP